MAPKSVRIDDQLAQKIRQRRIELNLTIEEAASRAGVGTKTWCRYEAGNPIRQDKCKGICKALNWRNISDFTEFDEESMLSFADKNHEAWSSYLERRFGKYAASSFACGSDILLDHINEDLAELATKPAGTHIGQIGASFLMGDLPEQFLMHYDYEFLHLLKCSLIKLRRRAKGGYSMVAHTVVEELLIYLCNEEYGFMEDLDVETYGTKAFNKDNEKEWIFDLFDDEDVITCLYTNWHIDEGHSYHFIHWAEKQFWMDLDINE